MDASTIRLILIVVGALVILLLYLWERQRERRKSDEEHFPMHAEEDADAPYGVQSSTREPEPESDIDDYDDDEPYEKPRQSSWSQPSQSIDERFGRETLDPDSEDAPAEDPDPVMTMPSLEPLLIQLSISARRYSFKGTDLIEVAESCGLYPGDMDIFHCLDEFDDHTRVYFSMANMIKPGTFAFDDMENFSTPGLMLFAQLEGAPEDMTILDEMVATARKLALALNGDVLDETRRPLTVAKEETMRQAVLDNEMRWAKAMMR